MKWVVFAAALLVIAPFNSWLRRNPHHVPAIWSLAGLLVFIQGMAYFTKIGLVSWPSLPLTTHGLEVTVLDLVLAALWLAQPRGGRATPLTVARLVYVVAIVASMAQAQHPMAVLFVAWQMLRMYFAFSVVVHACRDPRVPGALLRGMSAGVLFTCALSLSQRYLAGFHETTGPFEHQNLVAMMCNFAVLPTFSLFLVRRTHLLTMLTPLAGIIAVVLSLSRGGLAVAVLGLGAVLVFSLRQFTDRKLAIALSGLLIVAAVLVKAADQLEIRFMQRSYGTFAATGDQDERARLELASQLMLRDHPLGVGANHFTIALHTGGYFERVGLMPHWSAMGSRVTDEVKVHNLYWMIATELGALGLLAYLFLALAVLTAVFAKAWRARRHWRGDVIFAIGVALFLFMAQGLVEWVQLRSVAQYGFWMMAGLALGLGVAEPRRVPSGPPGLAVAGFDAKRRPS
jgi:O-antigen ligase